MIKHIWIIIWNQRKSNAWLWAELLLVSVCLWYVVDFVGTVWLTMRQPVGFNVEHTYQLNLKQKTPGSEGYIEPENKQTSLGEDVLQIMERVRILPMVENTSISISSQPFVSSMNMSFQRLFYSDTLSVHAQEFRVSTSFFDVFKIYSHDQSISKLEEALTEQSIILSEDAAQELFPGGVAIGQRIRVGEEGFPLTVKAISTPIRQTEYYKRYPCYFTLLSEAEIIKELKPEHLPSLEICVRIKPEFDVNFKDSFISEMASNLEVGNLFLIDVRSTGMFRERVVGYEKALMIIRLLLMVFLLVNIFIGVSGSFWLRTRQRRGEIGLRVALGSSRSGLQKLLILEGVVMLTLAIIPAAIICLNIGIADLVELYWMDFTVLRYLCGILVSYIIMILIIISGIWYPAHYTMKMEPAEALRYE